jgi:uncharacterized protein
MPFPRQFLLGLLGALSVIACSEPPLTHEQEVAAWRAEKDAFMREAPESPVLPEQRTTFAPLLYFPIDENYRAPAALTLAESDVVLELPTSTGLRRKMRRVGTLTFTLSVPGAAGKGPPHTLTAFVDATERDMRRLFVPFGDLTNGTESYNGGRYLDLDRTASGVYDLDFNRAYFPFCYYNPAFDCPLPPRENRLEIPIRAGERMEPATPDSQRPIPNSQLPTPKPR